MSPEREKEFQELSAYLNFYASFVWGIDPDAPSHPSNALKRMVEDFGRSRALEGLRQATNDTIEDSGHLSRAELTELDSKCRSVGVVTVSEIWRRYSASFRRIVKRSSIRNDTEYHLVNGVVVDLAGGISDGERMSLQSMIDAYEAQW